MEAKSFEILTLDWDFEKILCVRKILQIQMFWTSPYNFLHFSKRKT